jgi:hypothetical protein
MQEIPINPAEFSINCNYQYHDHEMIAILRARIIEESMQETVCMLSPLSGDGVMVDNLEGRLTEEREQNRGKRTLLIPCNIGGNHWVALVLKINKDNRCAVAEYLNSTASTEVPKSLQEQLSRVYEGASFTGRNDLFKQDDVTSCGPCTIENLILCARGEGEAEETMESIRRRQITSLRLCARNTTLRQDRKLFRESTWLCFLTIYEGV